MTARAASRWNLAMSALLILLVAMGLAQQWPDRGLWYDETVNAYFAEHSLGEIWEWCTAIDNQVPLDFVLRNLWGAVAGTSEFSLRAFSFYCALLSVAGVIALGRRVGSSWFVGWFAGGIYALSQSFIYAAFEVRAYALGLALLAWSSVVLWELWMRYGSTARHLDRRYWRLLVAYWVLALALLYTHYTGAVALAVHGAFVGVETLQRRSARQITVLVHLVVGLVIGYIPWLIAISGRDVRAGTAYFAHVKPFQALKTYTEFYTYGQHMVVKDTPPYALMLTAAIVLFMGVWPLLNRQCRGDRCGYGFAVLMLMLPLVGLVMMVYGVQAKLSGRHVWPAWIGAALVIALGVNALGRLRGAPWLRWAAGIGVVLLVWLPGRTDLPLIYNSYLREAFAYIEKHADSGDVLVLHDGTLFTAADYYDSSLPWIGLPPDKLTDVEHFLFIDDALPALEALIQEHHARRVWVLTWQGHIMDPQDLVGGLLEWLGHSQPLDDAYGFGDVRVELFVLDRDPHGLHEQVGQMKPLVETPGGGPVYLGGEVLNEAPVPHGGILLVHTWWGRGKTVMPEVRVSVRLYSSDGNFYAQHDQPPASPSFGQEHWDPNSPILSRFVLWVPDDMPPGPAEVRLLIYHMKNNFEPIMVTVGTFEVQD